MFLRLLPRFREAESSLRVLSERESWANRDIEQLQLEKINSVWSHARQSVPHFAAIAKNLPERFTSLREYSESLPLLTKREVQNDGKSLLSQQAEPGKWRRTGGSTGTPMCVFWSKRAHREMLRCEYRYYENWGVHFLDRAAWIWGHGASFSPGLRGVAERLRRPVEDFFRGRLRLSAYRLARAELKSYLHQMERFQPKILFGYSQAVWLLAQVAADEGFEIPSIRHATLTAEPATDAMLAAVSDGLKTSAATIYGSVECGALAQQVPDGTLRVREDHVFLETLPREDGRYDVVVSVLNNPSFPLLRYVIGDVTDQPLLRPERGFAVLRNVVGRSSDFLVTRANRLIHPARFEALFHFEFGGVLRSFVYQREDGAVEISLVPRSPSTVPDLRKIESTVSELLEGYPVQATVAESIPCSRSGKQRLVVSDLLEKQRRVELKRWANDTTPAGSLVG